MSSYFNHLASILSNIVFTFSHLSNNTFFLLTILKQIPDIKFHLLRIQYLKLFTDNFSPTFWLSVYSLLL